MIQIFLKRFGQCGYIENLIQSEKQKVHGRDEHVLFCLVLSGTQEPYTI